MRLDHLLSMENLAKLSFCYTLVDAHSFNIMFSFEGSYFLSLILEIMKRILQLF